MLRLARAWPSQGSPIPLAAGEGWRAFLQLRKGPCSLRTSVLPAPDSKSEGGGKLAAAAGGQPNGSDERGGPSLASVPGAALLLPTAECLQLSPIPFLGTRLLTDTLKTSCSVSGSLTCSPFMEPSNSSSSASYFGTQGPSQPVQSTWLCGGGFCAAAACLTVTTAWG